jgi:hypothetical protein
MEKTILLKTFRQYFNNQISLNIGLKRFLENNLSGSIRKMSILSISSLVLLFSFSSCATLTYAYRGFKCPVYFDINSDDLTNTQFFIDGKPIKCKMVEFSATQVASGWDYNTFKVTYLPAIKINPVHKYYTLTVKNEKYGQKDILLKKGIAEEASAYLFLNIFLNGGLGTVIDILDNSLMKLPSVNMESVANKKSPIVYYNTKVQTKLSPSSISKNN